MVQPVKSDVNDVSPESVELPDVFAAALGLQRTTTHAQQGSMAPYSNRRALDVVESERRLTCGIEMGRRSRAGPPANWPTPL